MKFAITCAAALFACSIASIPALADEPENEANAQEKAEEVGEAEDDGTQDDPVAVEAPEIKKGEKRICRRVKLDMSSRRATKVCKTSDEWREFNQQR